MRTKETTQQFRVRKAFERELREKVPFEERISMLRRLYDKEAKKKKSESIKKLKQGYALAQSMKSLVKGRSQSQKPTFRMVKTAIVQCMASTDVSSRAIQDVVGADRNAIASRRRTDVRSVDPYENVHVKRQKRMDGITERQHVLY